MLADQILATLKFFDLQELPLTQFELYKYLLADPGRMRAAVDGQFELRDMSAAQAGESARLSEVIWVLEDLLKEGKVEEQSGYYVLPGRLSLVNLRLTNYANGIVRERKVRRWLKPASYVPFIRGIALSGSQPLGQQRPTSDIDLFIITDPRFMWTARTFLTAYFQVLGRRRHGNKIANRFCLNHYLAKIRAVDVGHNLYTAMEYLKLRPVVYEPVISAFQQANASWIPQFFPNAEFPQPPEQSPTSFQKFLEKIYIAIGGRSIEKKLGAWQHRRIREDKFILVRDDELSFHPGSKQEALLAGFFEFQK